MAHGAGDGGSGRKGAGTRNEMSDPFVPLVTKCERLLAPLSPASASASALDLSRFPPRAAPPSFADPVLKRCRLCCPPLDTSASIPLSEASATSPSSLPLCPPSCAFICAPLSCLLPRPDAGRLVGGPREGPFRGRGGLPAPRRTSYGESVGAGRAGGVGGVGWGSIWGWEGRAKGTGGGGGKGRQRATGSWGGGRVLMSARAAGGWRWGQTCHFPVASPSLRPRDAARGASGPGLDPKGEGGRPLLSDILRRGIYDTVVPGRTMMMATLPKEGFQSPTPAPVVPGPRPSASAASVISYASPFPRAGRGGLRMGFLAAPRTVPAAFSLPCPALPGPVHNETVGPGPVSISLPLRRPLAA